MKHCQHQSSEFLCLQPNDYYTFSEIFDLTEIREILKNLKIAESHKDRIAKDLVSYLITKQATQDKFKQKHTEFVILKIKEMYEKYPSKYLDWLPMINNQLLSDSQRSLDDKILIYNPQLLEGLYKLFTETDETWV